MTGLRVLCKDCWLAHEAATLLARCKECEANTQISRLDPLESKGGAGPFPRSGPLVCRHHPSEPLDIYCGTCRAELSPRALIGEKGVVALVGDTYSGKTSLLWVLSERLRQMNPAGAYIRQSIGDSDEQMANAVQSIFSRGRMTATPATDADVRNYAWELVLPSGGSHVIAFHDAAGEIWNELAKLSRTSYDGFYRYLDLAGSFLFAVDGERLRESIDALARGGISTPQERAAQVHEISIIDAIARRMRAANRAMPLAVVVTKADILWDDDPWTAFRPGSGASGDAIDATVRDLLRTAGRQSLMNAIEDSFAPVRYFAISAFGSVAQEPLRIEDLRPARVEEPLLALLETPFDYAQGKPVSHD